MNTKNEQVFALLDATGLNWTVKKTPLFVIDANSPEPIAVPSYGIMKGNKHLGTVGTQYEPFQNYQLAETLIEATESLNIHTTRGGYRLNNKAFELLNEYVEKNNPKPVFHLMN